LLDILTKGRDIAEQMLQLRNTVNDITFNIGQFEKYGIADKFKKQTDFEKDNEKLNGMLEDIQGFYREIQTLLDDRQEPLKQYSTYVSQQNGEFFKKVLQEYSLALDNIQHIVTNVGEIKLHIGNLEKLHIDYQKIKDDAEEEFAQTRRELESEIRSHGIEALKLEDYTEFYKSLASTEARLKLLKKQEEIKSRTEQQLQTSLRELAELWRKEFQQIDGELSKINNSQSAIKITAEFEGNRECFKQYLQTVYRGSGLRETTFTVLVDKYQDFIAVYQDFENACNQLTDAAQIPFMQNTQNILDALLTYQVPNKYIIEYHGKELKNHSLGQRASALILFVLSQKENDVIIIDQPEDDLDNQTIYEEVIKQIIELKPTTQFIFATHNANIPVLGDAEMIHTCNFGAGKITVTSGSIDCPKTQASIIDIMEGGPAAFERRKEICEQWT